MGMTCGPAATWQPRHRNHLAKPPDGKKRTVSRVRGPKISGFRVRWLKSNFDNSSMAKNGLLPLNIIEPNLVDNLFIP
jgi:hypothetical protein